jgi:hypothetical protein
MPFYLMIIRVKYAIDDAYGVLPPPTESSGNGHRKRSSGGPTERAMLAFLRQILPSVDSWCVRARARARVCVCVCVCVHMTDRVQPLRLL